MAQPFALPAATSWEGGRYFEDIGPRLAVTATTIIVGTGIERDRR